MKILYVLFVFIPIAILAEIFHWGSTLVLVSSALSMIPLAGLMGEATEELAEATGPKLGGLLNATLGNAAELIITLVALQAGKYTLIKASIAGSILSNLVMGVGLSLLLGGMKNGLLKYDRTAAGVNSTMLLIAVTALIVPTVFAGSHSPAMLTQDLNHLSIGVACILLVMYVLGVIFTFSRSPTEAHLTDMPLSGGGLEGDATPGEHEPSEHAPRWSVKFSLMMLAIATIFIVALSELLVGAVEPVVQQWGISEFFIGLILVPIVGNAAEYIVAIRVALKNQMDLSLSISLGSSTQIALFVAPVLVLLSFIMGPTPMDLHFHMFEVVAVTLGVLTATFISLDGESTWLEGAQLLAVYMLFGVASFFMR